MFFFRGLEESKTPDGAHFFFEQVTRGKQEEEEYGGVCRVICWLGNGIFFFRKTSFSIL
jgi:hypothetical protein